MSGVALETSDVRLQYGVLPWREVEGALQILLITTQTTKRWIVPKGWPVPGLRPSECAAHEALEEAGVVGEIARRPIGSFHYEKRRKSGTTRRCRVDIFPMEVVRQRRNWPEKRLRETRWCSIEEALRRVREPGLARLIATFAVRRNDATVADGKTSA